MKPGGAETVTLRDQPNIAVAQEAKRRLSLDQSVELSLPKAALAFGIPVERLRQMSETGEVLVLQPRDEKVLISLKESIADWRRDLWNEMLVTLSEGRQKASFRFYDFLYFFTQAAATGQEYLFFGQRIPLGLKESESFMDLWRQIQDGKAIAEGDLDILQKLIYIQWFTLGQGTQNNHADIDPSRVLSSLGIAGSGD